jgi:hypothetical protein
MYSSHVMYMLKPYDTYTLSGPSLHQDSCVACELILFLEGVLWIDVYAYHGPFDRVYHSRTQYTKLQVLCLARRRVT